MASIVPASQDIEICSFNNPCVAQPPPPLLNLDQALYVATPAQKDSLRKLEAQAAANVITFHGLTAADTTAVQTWARFDTLAELYALIVASISASPRTTDQQNVADWVSAVGQRLAVGAAQAAGREYVTWAGLDQFTYESLLNRGATLNDLRTFLSGAPANYNNPNTSQSTGGWCSYQSPEPYSSEYEGRSHITCFSSCPSAFGCQPPTPKYDQFVKWGQGAASYSFLNSQAFAGTARKIATVWGLAASVTAAIVLATLPAAVLVGAPSAAVIAAVALESGVAITNGLLPFATGIASSIAGIASVAAIIVAAIVIAIVAGIAVISASELPGQLAELITDARTTPPDPSTLITTTDGGTSLFSIFVGATLPEPLFATCEPGGLPPGVTFSGGFYTLAGTTPCLNPSPIPPASATDPQFLVKANGATTETITPTLTFNDASGTVTTARLSKNWFITQANGRTVQTLVLEYTGWDGSHQNAWVLGNPTAGYGFVTFATADTSASLDPTSCVSNGLCSSSDTIKYVGSDGQDYSAKVRGYLAALGSPKSSAGVEGSPVSFDANGFTIPDAVGAVVRTWRFQKEGCGDGVAGCMTFDPTTMQQTPSYTDPVAGSTATHTWTLAGSYLVELRATDSRNVSVSNVFSVTIENVAPTLLVFPDCSTNGAPGTESFCVPRTANPGETVRVEGWFDDIGERSDLTVTIAWGDGSRVSECISPGRTCLSNFGSPLQLAKYEGQQQYNFDGQHTYPAPGTYYGTVWVTDPMGGADSETFVITIKRAAQTITFPAIATQTYGGGAVPISATGGSSGQPVTFGLTDSSVCALSNSTVSGTTANAAVTLLKAGACIITASQTGNGDYDPAEPVTHSFDIQRVSLAVTASSPTITYGAALPAITPSYDGFVSSDGPSSLDTPPTCSTAAQSGADAGSYQTTCTGAVDSSYSVGYVAGKLTINKAATTMALNSAPAAVVKGQPVTFTATVRVTSPGAGHPGGPVAFNDGAAAVSGCAAVPIDTATNTATCTTSVLGIGPHSITAVYSGDTNFTGSTPAAALAKTVGKAATGTILAASVSPSISSKSVIFTAAVSITAPGAGSSTGAVTFFDGTTRLGTGQLSVVGTKVQATFSTSSLAVGRHSITATYAGDADFTTSTSAALVHYVNTDISSFPKQANGAYNLNGTTLRSAYLVGVSLVGATLNNSNLESAVLIGADLTNATVLLTNMSGTNLTNAVLAGAQLKDSTFKNANFTGANLTGAAFNNSTLKDATGLNTATLTGVVWTQTTCPNATLSNSNGGTCVGRW